MSTAVSFKQVDILFGRNQPAALALLDSKADRSEILRQTQVVLGCAGCSLDVKAGEISVLMGLSGSGKSTLLRGVNGLNKITRGTIEVSDGQAMVDVSSCSKVVLRRLRQKNIAMVFQQFGLLPWRTVAENVGLGLELTGVKEAARKARVGQQLILVGLEQWADKYAHELSGGMQQRVGLARAFATDAPILLMDEPFSALDPLIRNKLQDELLQLQKSLKKTIIFVSHDLEEALKLGNTISIMEGGRIIQSGKPEEIVLRPATPYVRDFVAHVNPLSVLTAWNVMRGIHELERDTRGWIWLDKNKTTRFKLGPDNRVTTMERGGLKVECLPCSEVDSPRTDKSKPIFWATPNTSLKTVMLAMHKSDAAPVALFNENQTFVGAIGMRDVLRAVLKKEV